jgi:hypothetical protein
MKTDKMIITCKFEGETLGGHPEGFGHVKYVHKKNENDNNSFTGIAEFRNR